MALVPTLELWEYELERAGFAPERIDEWIRTAQAQVRAYAALDGEILFGTDVGYMTDYDPSDEYAYLAEAGLSFDRILASLTTAPAERFGVAGTSGRVAEGFEADLVLLEGDPVADPRALARVRYAIREGEVVYRKP